MCGITGFINIGNKENLTEITNLISHRGPDDWGVEWFSDCNSGFGHRRLSIIDLSPAGHQPMSNEDDTLWITFNGEIYNYKDIRAELISKGYKFISESDTEVMLKAYDCWKENCLQKFNGMFAFVIYDKKENLFFGARDRVGIKPFYYYLNNHSLIFASEIKAILASGLIEKKPDYYSLFTPTRYQISPNTGFKNINKLPAGKYFKFKLENSDFRIKSYWDIFPFENVHISENDAIEKLDYLIQDSVRLQMIADVPVGIFLSGGLDSSIIAASMRKNTNNDIHSFTIKFAEEDQRFEKLADDSYYSKLMADKFNFIHHEFIISPDIESLFQKMVWHMDEPLADSASINTYIMSQYANDLGIVVLLNGMGGDEIFGGYRKHLACIKADVFRLFVPEIFRHFVYDFFNLLPIASKTQGFRNIRWIKRFLQIATQPQYERFLSSDLSLTEKQFNLLFLNKIKYKDSHYYQSQLKYFDISYIKYLTKLCLIDSKVFLPEHNLNYSDKSSMAASIESRPPLTDHRILDFLFSLTPEMRINGNRQKYLLKKVSEKYLPQEVINRPKAPFGSPLRSWLKGPLSEMVNDLLSESSLKKRGLYNSSFVRKLIDRDSKGIEDNAIQIWTLLTNEMWFRTFFDK